MAKIIGRLVDVGLAAESSRGGGLAPTFWIPKASYNFDDKTEKARSRQSYGKIPMDGNQAIPAKSWSEGTLEMDMMDKPMGLILYALLGAKSVAGPTDSSYTHTFTIANTNQHQSLAVTAVQSTLASLMYKLTMIESMTMEIVPEEIVKITLELKCKRAVTTVATATYATAYNKFVGRDLSFKLATLTSGLTAASNIPLKKLTLKIEKNLYPDFALGTVQPIDILNQGFRITGEVELDYQDRTYANYMSDGSYRAMRIKLTNARTDAVIGAATSPAFTLDLSRVEFDSWEPDYPNDEIVKQKFNFTALYDTVNGDLINSCTLVNAQSSY
jgi:hypothetical protein